MEHSDRENAKRAIEEVHKKYNAAASTEQQRQAQPVAAASTADKDNSDDADLTKLLARAVGQSGDDEEDVNGKAFFKIKYKGLDLTQISHEGALLRGFPCRLPA